MKVTDNDRPRIAAAVADLMFGSKIRGAAEHAGVDVTFVRSAVALTEAAAGAAMVVLDLETRWLEADAAIRGLKADPATAAVPVVAFAPHVRTDVLATAHEAGADRVLARSAFVRELPELLASLWRSGEG